MNRALPLACGSIAVAVLGLAASASAAPNAAEPSDGTASKAVSIDKSKPAAKPSAATKKWVTGQVRTRKTQMGIGLRYAMTEPVVGDTSPMHLKLTRLGQGDPVTIELRPDPEIGIASGFPTGPVTFNAGDEYTVRIRPGAEGLHYIHVYLQSGDRAEAMAIPVQVGQSARLSKPGQVSTSPDGQRVISLPAQQ